MHAIMVGIGLYLILTLYTIVDIRGPSMVVIIMDPRLATVAKGI